MTTETLTLTAFLLARIAEDAAAAENVLADRPPGASPNWDMDAGYWGPARVLAECEAKRRIVARCDYATTDEFGSDYDLAPRYDLGLEVLQALALPYADHPDCREEWKP